MKKNCLLAVKKPPLPHSPLLSIQFTIIAFESAGPCGDTQSPLTK